MTKNTTTMDKVKENERKRQKEKRQLLEEATRIQKILSKGYYIAEGTTILGKKEFYLIPENADPFKNFIPLQEKRELR